MYRNAKWIWSSYYYSYMIMTNDTLWVNLTYHMGWELPFNNEILADYLYVHTCRTIPFFYSIKSIFILCLRLTQRRTLSTYNYVASMSVTYLLATAVRLIVLLTQWCYFSELMYESDLFCYFFHLVYPVCWLFNHSFGS
jgi:hypothetical protein